jgi:hypothetical protein
VRQPTPLPSNDSRRPANAQAKGRGTSSHRVVPSICSRAIRIAARSEGEGSGQISTISGSTACWRVDSRATPVPRTRASALLAVWPSPSGCPLPAVSFSTPRLLDSSTRLTVEYCRACAAG